jgi:hypothetical protein
MLPPAGQSIIGRRRKQKLLCSVRSFVAAQTSIHAALKADAPANQAINPLAAMSGSGASAKSPESNAANVGISDFFP